jgi:hypothetical protein
MRSRTCRFTALAAALSCAVAAHAQLRMPALGSTLSPLLRPGYPLLQRVDPLLDTALAPVDLAATRLAQTTQRARAYRRELDRDPQGELIVRAEVLAQPSSPAARDALLAAGFSPLRDDALDGLDDALLVMKAPPGLGLAEAIARAHAIDPAGAYDFHHVYVGGGGIGAPTAASGAAPVIEPAPRLDAGPLQVGLIDSGVDAAHPALRHADIRRHGCADRARPAPHGTAVASLMVGEDAHFKSALPRAVLYAGDA